jgi:Flp pilus assembly protein TadB
MEFGQWGRRRKQVFSDRLTPKRQTKESMKKSMNWTKQPRPLMVVSAILGILLIIVVVVFGLSATTRGPIEILLALFIAALLLLFAALSRRSR